MFNFFKKQKATKQCCNKVSNKLILETYKNKVTESMKFIEKTLQPTILECHRLNDSNKRDSRKQIQESLQKTLVPFYPKLKETIDCVMKYSFKYDLGYLEKALHLYDSVENDIKRGVIRPERLYQSLDSLHQLYARVCVGGAIRTDIKSKLNKAYEETKIMNSLLAVLLTSICATQRRETK